MSVIRYQDKILTFIDFGDRLAELSTCKRLKVGAIVFACDCSAVYAVGYNGPSRGRANDSCTGDEGECGCAHAEANAIAKFNNDRAKPSIFYTTHSPCLFCASIILNCTNIVGVIYRLEYRTAKGINLIKSAGIPIICIDDLDIGHEYLYHWKRTC